MGWQDMYLKQTLQYVGKGQVVELVDHLLVLGVILKILRRWLTSAVHCSPSALGFHWHFYTSGAEASMGLHSLFLQK